MAAHLYLCYLAQTMQNDGSAPTYVIDLILHLHFNFISLLQHSM